jgi:Domain of unknown function (DUF1844)
MPKDKSPEFTVTDKRKFNFDGEVRNDAPVEETSSEPPAPVAAPVAEAPKPEPPKQPASSPEPELPQEPLPDTGYDSEKLQGAFGGQKIEFIHLLDMLVQTAMMYAGAMDNGPERRVDIVGMRQMIDMISMLEEKTKGNLNQQEQTVMSNTLFQLRMSYMEIVNMIEKQATQGPPPGGGIKK